MTGPIVTGVRAVRRVPVTGAQLDTLPGATYSAAYRLRTTTRAAPQSWARALFEGAPLIVRIALWLGWRYLLGLRLGPRHAPGYVQGWTVTASDADSVTLAAASRLVDARNQFLVDASSVTWVSMVRPRTLLGRLLWACAAPIHHLSIRVLLPRAKPAPATARG